MYRYSTDLLVKWSVLALLGTIYVIYASFRKKKQFGLTKIVKESDNALVLVENRKSTAIIFSVLFILLGAFFTWIVLDSPKAEPIVSLFVLGSFVTSVFIFIKYYYVKVLTFDKYSNKITITKKALFNNIKNSFPLSDLKEVITHKKRVGM